MRYFVDEEERKASGGTCYFEFQKGKYRNKHWLKDSICIHANLFDELLLFRLFVGSLGSFDYYGPANVIEKEQWHFVKFIVMFATIGLNNAIALYLLTPPIILISIQFRDMLAGFAT